jgi:hypothetical protein
MSFLREFAKNAQSQNALRIVHDTKAKTYTVAGTLDLSQIGPDNPMIATFTRTLDVRIAVTLPGEVIEHNGTLDGTTVTWVGKPGEKLDIHAVSEEASTIPWVPVLAIGIPVLIVIAALVAWLVVRRRSAAPQPPPDLAPPTDPWRADLQAQQWPQADGQAGPPHN